MNPTNKNQSLVPGGILIGATLAALASTWGWASTSFASARDIGLIKASGETYQIALDEEDKINFYKCKPFKKIDKGADCEGEVILSMSKAEFVESVEAELLDSSQDLILSEAQRVTFREVNTNFESINDELAYLREYFPQEQSERIATLEKLELRLKDKEAVQEIISTYTTELLRKITDVRDVHGLIENKDSDIYRVVSNILFKKLNTAAIENLTFDEIIQGAHDKTLFENCHLKMTSDFSFFQVMVNGEFNGNYDARTARYSLANELKRLTSLRICRLKEKK